MKDREPLRVETVSFGELEETGDCCARLGLKTAQVRSLKTHPYAKVSDPAALLLMRGSQRIGRFGFIPGRMKIGEAEYPIFWGSTWEGERGAAAGLLLLQAVSAVPNLGACGISEAAMPLYRAARFKIMTMRRRSLLLRSGPFLRRRLGPAVARALSGACDIGLLTMRQASRLWTRQWSLGFSLEAVEQFDASLDEVERSGRGRCWFPRDHREINWAMAFPWISLPDYYRTHGFYLRRQGTSSVAGYALVRIRSLSLAGLPEEPPAILASLLRFAVRRDIPNGEEALLDLLISWADKHPIDTFEICTSRPRLERFASLAGMIPRGVIELACHFSPAVESALAESGRALSDFEADMGEGDVLFA